MEDGQVTFSVTLINGSTFKVILDECDIQTFEAKVRNPTNAVGQEAWFSTGSEHHEAHFKASAVIFYTREA